MPVELILDNSAGPKSVRVSQVRVGKRRISLLVRTNQNIAFVPEKILTKGFQRNQCYLQQWSQDVAVHHSHPPENDCCSKQFENGAYSHGGESLYSLGNSEFGLIQNY